MRPGSARAAARADQRKAELTGRVKRCNKPQYTPKVCNLSHKSPSSKACQQTQPATRMNDNREVFNLGQKSPSNKSAVFAGATGTEAAMIPPPPPSPKPMFGKEAAELAGPEEGKAFCRRACMPAAAMAERRATLDLTVTRAALGSTCSSHMTTCPATVLNPHTHHICQPRKERWSGAPRHRDMRHRSLST